MKASELKINYIEFTETFYGEFTIYVELDHVNLYFMDVQPKIEYSKTPDYIELNGRHFDCSTESYSVELTENDLQQYEASNDNIGSLDTYLLSQEEKDFLLNDISKQFAQYLLEQEVHKY